MYLPRHVLLAALVVLLGMGCGKTPDATPLPPADPHANHQMEMGSQNTTTPQPSRVVLETKNWPAPGPITLAFRLLGKDGGDLKESDLKIVHEKRVHLLLVRDDLTQFQHLHPTYELLDGNYRWVARTTVPEAGDYQLYVDISPEKEEPMVLRISTRIGGSTATNMSPAPSSDMSATTEGIQAKLTTPSSIMMGQPARLTFTLTKNSQPIRDIEPYLGAYGHVVILRHNAPEDFLHVHPVTQTKPMDGKVEFETMFKTKGRYTLFAQFAVGESVKTFPITIDVDEGAINAVEGTNTPVMMDHSQH